MTAHPSGLPTVERCDRCSGIRAPAYPGGAVCLTCERQAKERAAAESQAAAEAAKLGDYVIRCIADFAEPLCARIQSRAEMNERTAAAHPDPTDRALAAARAEGYRMALRDVQERLEDEYRAHERAKAAAR